MRVYDEQIEVAVDEQFTPDALAPVSFVWRGQRFTIRAVLDRWVARTPWWRTALQADLAPAGSQVTQGQLPDLEERVWRVEAAAGRRLSTGVFELACSLNGSWRLCAVLD